MLLALVPDLIRTKTEARELYELYDFMVNQWLDREHRWVPNPVLKRISTILAIEGFNGKTKSGREQFSPEDLERVSRGNDGASINWKFLSARSLLNRDSAGNFKFAHRSVMEFLYVQAAVSGDERCFSRPWTDFMRQLFVSWGLVNNDSTSVARAREILGRDLGKLGLAPLASALPTPRRINLTSLTGARGWPSLGAGEQIRKVNPEWRAHSLRTRFEDNVVRLEDYSYDLAWTLPQTAQIRDFADINAFRVTIRDAEYMLGGANSRDLIPSLEEFKSLLEATMIIGRVDLLDKRLPYWLGDTAGHYQNVFLTISESEVEGSQIRLIEKQTVVVGSASQTICIYETAHRTKPGEAQPFLAATVAVHRGLAMPDVAYLDINEMRLVFDRVMDLRKRRDAPR